MLILMCSICFRERHLKNTYCKSIATDSHGVQSHSDADVPGYVDVLQKEKWLWWKDWVHSCGLHCSRRLH